MKEERRMKRWLTWMIIFVWCLSLTGFAAAEEANLDLIKLEPAYRAIKDYYTMADDAQHDDDLEDTVSTLEKLILYYEKQEQNISLSAYKDARFYYAYAQGLLELCKPEPDYSLAREYFDEKNSGNDLERVRSYRRYAQGMEEMKNKDYAAAIEHLRDVIGLPTKFSSDCSTALEYCEAAYKKAVLEEGPNACDNGDHKKALDLYEKYLNLFNHDEDIRRLRDECEKYHAPQPADQTQIYDEAAVKNLRAVPTAQRSVKLTWEGTKEAYTVTWTSDLFFGTDAHSAEVQGKTFTVTDLLPGTVYRFTVNYQNTSIHMDRETKEAEKYADNLWTGSSTLFRFDNSRYTFLESGKTSYEFANDKSCNLEYLKKDTVELFENPISESAILFVFTTSGIPRDINGKDYLLLLHIDGTATLTEKGKFGKANEDGIKNVCADGTDIYVLVYDLFDQAVENYSDLSGKAFRLDLLVDEKYVASSNGILQ